jgi:hypothetical protein
MSLMLDRQEAMTELPPGIDQPQAAELTADRVKVRFQGLAAISDISLTINRREIFGLIGPNGRNSCRTAASPFRQPCSAPGCSAPSSRSFSAAPSCG